MSELEALLLDAGNTLCYLDVPALAAILADHGLLFPSLEAAHRAEARARPRLSDHLAARSASTEAAASFRCYVELALDEAGVSWDPARLDRAFEAICTESKRSGFFRVPAPGAHEALARLKAAGFRLGVVSNSNGTVEAKLQRTGFAPYLETIVDSAVERVEKPDPRIFRIACERLGLEPSRTAYVGDLYAIDVVGCRAAGLHPVLLDPHGAYAERGVDAETVRDVAELASRLLARRASRR